MPKSRAASDPECDVDDETDTDPFRHIVASALELPPPTTKAACSIFDVAERAASAKRKGGVGMPQSDPLPPLKATIQRCTSDGIVRNIGAVYPIRWTEEDFERERTRRAKQRPPRPLKRFRTKSKKLQAMTGDEVLE